MKKLCPSKIKHGQKVIVATGSIWFRDEIICVSDSKSPSEVISLKGYGTIFGVKFYPDTKQTRTWMLIQQIQLSKI